jgi:pSer/pThr/pTyr-binding forkhead associated (FHA) protein
MTDDQMESTIETPEDLVETPDADVEPEPAEIEQTSTGATLTVKRGGAESDDVFTFQPPATIGRFDPTVGPIDVDLGNLPEAAYVSRRHARITLDGDVWKITDMGSSNGTFVLRDDFERVDQAELSDGDEIALGNARLVFRLLPQVQ